MKTRLFWGLLFGVTIAMQWVPSAQPGTPNIPLQFIKQSGVVLAEYNTPRRTLTIRGGLGELWICTTTSTGKTCKSGEDVLNWITREGDTHD